MLRDLLLHLAKLGLGTVRLHAVAIGSGLALFALLLMVFHEAVSRALSALGWLRLYVEYLFQLACAALFLLVFYDFLVMALASPADAKAMTTLLPTLLILALAGLYGRHLFARLKKIGPLEFLEEKAPELNQELKNILEPVDVEIDRVLGAPSPPAIAYAYRRFLALTQFLEFSGSLSATRKSKDKKATEKLSRLFFRVGQLAILADDWWAAQGLLERVRDLSGDKFESFKVSYNLGMAYLQQGLSTKEGSPARAKELLRQAATQFTRATEKNRLDPDSFFWLAYTQDELGMLDLAIMNNRKVLRRRHAYAPAKYNIVISRIKKGQMAKALKDLLAITPEDEAWPEMFSDALTDEELLPLLDHLVYGARARDWLESQQDPALSGI